MPTVGGETRLRRRVPRQLPRERDVRRAAPDRARDAREGARPRATSSSSTARRPAATGSAARRVLASQELGEDDADKRPSVQIGDPFTGKKLIEASLELVERGLVESLQDCGAAGLASSLSEMAREGGIDVHLDRVPLREAGPGAVGGHDLREPGADGRGRAAASARRGRARSATAGSSRTRSIGEVTDTGELRAFCDDEVVGAIPARLLTDECPRYEVEPARPAAGRPRSDASGPTTVLELSRRRTSAAARGSTAATTTSSARARSAARASTRPSSGCGPSLPRARRLARRPGPDRAARPAHRRRARRARGGAQRRLHRRRAARADRLPQLRQPGEARDRLGARRGDRGRWPQACEALGIPVVSGNVSLYNETDGRAIHPTPVVGCVGLVPDVRARARRAGARAT